MLATGFSLTDLERDPDQRTVTLTMLSRLHDLLRSSVDEMLLTDRAAIVLAEHDPDMIDDIEAATHAQTLLAVLVSRDGIGVDVLLAATRWSIAELEAALTYLRAQLDQTALQAVATDVVLYLALRAGALPGPLRAALARPTAMRRGLDADTAIQLLRLVRKEILRPVPGEPIPLLSEVDPDRDVDTRFSMPKSRSGAVPNVATSSRSPSTTTTGSPIASRPSRACGSIRCDVRSGCG
ncbi:MULTISPECIES: hypothetical protein [Nocardia]|uniref:Uncharacterized protein n=1 Tax=Nocardia ignorata TaxID=145285 RepID=A0A4R6PKC1_NOCIG|nr:MULTISPECIES: hypothetical protein [Nocardia]MBC7302086.1 hypothetical protein [Nocardia sp.]TDP38551.1 hypothetical protein DFR75_103208 [Nocardia ignorata]